MSKLWLMALYEYKRHVLEKKFIIALLSVPLIVGLMIGLIALIAAMEEKSDAVGYVDYAGLLNDPVPAPLPGSSPDDPSVPKPVPLVPFATAAEARQALDAKELQAYYVISADYVETKAVELVYHDTPDWSVRRQFWDTMQINLLDDLPAEVAERAVAGSNLIVRWPADTPEGGREFSQRTFLNTFVPIITGITVVMLLFFASGYLMGAVVEEKENRTMEILVTSISSNQLIAGKVIGILGVVLTQFLFWVGFGALCVVVGGNWMDIELLQNIDIDLRMFAVTVMIAAPAFVMLAGLMTAAGATFADAQEAQQLTGLFVVPFMIPIWLLQPILEHPNSPLSIALSFFPPTSVGTYSLRLAFSEVPGWQIVASITISSLCAVGALWLAGRAFRLGMLRYGKQLNWRELFGRAAAGS